MKRISLAEPATQPAWMPVYISLMLVLLTLFVFLNTFTEKDPGRVRIFRENFKKALVLLGSGRAGSRSAVDVRGADPLLALVNRLKSETLSVDKMDRFLTVAQIKELRVARGERGVTVVVPGKLGFDGTGLVLNALARAALARIAWLATEIPYQVQVTAYSSSRIPAGYGDALGYSAGRALEVYRFLLAHGVPPVKLKMTARGDALARGGPEDNRIEISFQEPQL
jgi:flagellar motor protein MotB